MHIIFCYNLIACHSRQQGGLVSTDKDYLKLKIEILHYDFKKNGQQWREVFPSGWLGTQVPTTVGVGGEGGQGCKREEEQGSMKKKFKT